MVSGLEFLCIPCKAYIPLPSFGGRADIGVVDALVLEIGRSMFGRFSCGTLARSSPTPQSGHEAHVVTAGRRISWETCSAAQVIALDFMADAPRYCASQSHGMRLRAYSACLASVIPRTRPSDCCSCSSDFAAVADDAWSRLSAIPASLVSAPLTS